MSTSFKKMVDSLQSVVTLLLIVLAAVCRGIDIDVFIDEDHNSTSLRGTVFISMDGGQTLTKFCSEDLHELRVGGVVCRQLGHGPVISAKKVDSPPVMAPTWSIDCFGTEPTLSDCVYVSSLNEYSSICTGNTLEMECLPSVSREYTVALADDNFFYPDGTVHIYVNDTWGPICASNIFRQEIARVVCRQLGNTNGSAVYGGYTALYEDPVLIVSSCDGDEDKIQFCSVSDSFFLYPHCSSFEDLLEVSCFNETVLNTTDITSGGGSETAVASFVSGIIIFLIILCCVGSICYCACCRKTNNRRANAPHIVQSTTAMTSPPVVVPPPAYKDVMTSPAQGASVVHPPPQGYPQAGGPGYQPVPTQPPPYPPTGPGYPPTAGSGYPPPVGPGYPPAAGPGYPQGPGYPPTGYPSAPPPDHLRYPPQGPLPATGSSYPSSSGPGYPAHAPGPVPGTDPSQAGPHPYPVSEKQGPPPDEGYQYTAAPYPPSPGPPQVQDSPQASAPPLEMQVLDKV